MLLFPLLVSPSSGTIFAQALYTTDTCEIYLTLAGSLLGAKSRVRGVCRVEQIQGYMLTQMWEDNLLKKKYARDVQTETFKARL